MAALVRPPGNLLDEDTPPWDSIKRTVRYCKDARMDQASLTFVYSLRGSRYTINSQRYTSWFIYPARDVDYSWISPGEAVADSVELAGGFLGADFLGRYKSQHAYSSQATSSDVVY